MSQILVSDLAFTGTPIAPWIFTDELGSGDWGKLCTGESADGKSYTYVPYDRVWVFEQFPTDPFASWLSVANRFDQTGWWPVFIWNDIFAEEFEEESTDGSGLDVINGGNSPELLFPRITQRRSVKQPPFWISAPPNDVFGRNEPLSLSIVQVSEPVSAWSVACPNDAGALRDWMSFLYSWFRRFRVVPYVVGQETVMLVLDPPQSDDDCLSAYLERLSLSLECSYESYGEDNYDWNSVDEFLERAMRIRGRGIWTFW
jgi:hypothetical protein